MHKVIAQLRTGYTTLKKYKHKTGCSLTPYYECDEKGTIEHYMLHFHKYNSQRDTMYQNPSR